MDINPYLTFDGRCEEALAFYAETLGGRVLAVMRFEGSPMASHMPADFGSKVLHARAEIAGRIVLASDAPPERYQPPQGISMTIQSDDTAEAERVFGALADGGTVQMPIQQTFWAARFGMLVDRYGIAWMVNCETSA